MSISLPRGKGTHRDAYCKANLEETSNPATDILGSDFRNISGAKHGLVGVGVCENSGKPWVDSSTYHCADAQASDKSTTVYKGESSEPCDLDYIHARGLV